MEAGFFWSKGHIYHLCSGFHPHLRQGPGSTNPIPLSCTFNLASEYKLLQPFQKHSLLKLVLSCFLYSEMSWNCYFSNSVSLTFWILSFSSTNPMKLFSSRSLWYLYWNTQWTPHPQHPWFLHGNWYFYKNNHFFGFNVDFPLISHSWSPLYLPIHILF